jgi:hypothetical protein
MSAEDSASKKTPFAGERERRNRFVLASSLPTARRPRRRGAAVDRARHGHVRLLAAAISTATSGHASAVRQEDDHVAAPGERFVLEVVTGAGLEVFAGSPRAGEEVARVPS